MSLRLLAPCERRELSLSLSSLLLLCIRRSILKEAEERIAEEFFLLGICCLAWGRVDQISNSSRFCLLASLVRAVVPWERLLLEEEEEEAEGVGALKKLMGN